MISKKEFDELFDLIDSDHKKDEHCIYQEKKKGKWSLVVKGELVGEFNSHREAKRCLKKMRKLES